MRIGIVGDTHLGVRGDSLQFHNNNKKFYETVFFPYLIENNITTVIQTGDLMDRRKFVSFNTLYLTKKYFFNRFEELGIKLIVYLGNHDTYFRNSLEVNSVELVLQDYIDKGVIECIKSPKTIEFDKTPIDIIPWICEDNEKQITEFIKNTKSHVCFGHFEISGFEMDRGNVCHDGMSREKLDEYDLVISGHFHHKSSDGHIYYVGTPAEFTWADYGDHRGFHIFDTKTQELDFIENPYRMFYKITYDDKVETLESINGKDYSQYKDTYVKVIVATKCNPGLYDIFLEKLYEAAPLDVTIVEDFTDYSEITDEDIVDQSDDTMTTLDKFVEALEMGLDKNKLKAVMRDIYLQAQNVETK